MDNEIVQTKFNSKANKIYYDLRDAFLMKKSHIKVEKEEYEILKNEIIEFYKTKFRHNDEYKRKSKITKDGICYFYKGTRHGMKLSVEDFIYKTEVGVILEKIEKLITKIELREGNINGKQENTDRIF